jgi:hypothetical protein
LKIGNDSESAFPDILRVDVSVDCALVFDEDVSQQHMQPCEWRSVFLSYGERLFNKFSLWVLVNQLKGYSFLTGIEHLNIALDYFRQSLKERLCDGLRQFSLPKFDGLVCLSALA